MPLTKKAPAQTPPAAASTAFKDAQVPATAAPAAAAPQVAATTTAPAPAKKLGGTHKAGDRAAAPMTKDDYWRRREENDVAKDKRISRSGLFQAALQSTGLLQLNTGNTLEDYLKLVEQTAERGLLFINKE